MKGLLKIIFILNLFAFIGIATSKETLKPYDLRIEQYLRDAPVFGYYSEIMNDTIVISTAIDSL